MMPLCDIGYDEAEANWLEVIRWEREHFGNGVPVDVEPTDWSAWLEYQDELDSELQPAFRFQEAA